MKRLIRILLAGLMPWASAPALAQVKNPDTFVYLFPSDIDTLDPAWAYDGLSHEILYQLYDTLIFYKGTSLEEFEPLVASVVPSEANGLVSKDGLTYSFPIRKGMRFHDGTELTVEDARYSILRFLLTDRASGPSTLLLEPLLGVHTVQNADGVADPELYDEAEKAVRVEGGALVLRLKKPFAPLLSILAGFCPIVSKSFTVRNGGWDGTRETWIKHWNPAKNQSALYERVNGTGPFMLERWDRHNRQVILARHEGYWRKPARLKRLVFKTVPEQATRKLMLQNGDADAALMERQYLPQVAGLPGVRVSDDLPFLETHNAFLLTFRVSPEANPYIGSGRLDGLGIPPDFFADPEIRKAFAHSFDYDAYIQGGYRGKAERARGPIPKAIFGYHARQPVRPYDLARAAEHFKRARAGEIWRKGFAVTCVFMEGKSDRQLACQILKKGIESLNPLFRIDVRGVQWSTYLSHWSAGKIPLANARWSLDFPDPHNAVQPFLHSEGHFAKVQGYKNARADRFIEEAKGELDRAKRKALYAELHAIAYEDVPQIYTVDTYNFQVMRDWVQGWYYNPMIPSGYLYPVFKEAP